MIRGVHRFVINIGGPAVKVRAQSQSARGQAYTVRSTQVQPEDRSKASVKVAIRAAINEVYSAA